MTSDLRKWKELRDALMTRWDVLVLLATDGEPIGEVIRAALGVQPENPPLLGDRGVILADGCLYANRLRVLGAKSEIFRVGPIDDVTDALRRVCEDCELQPDEAAALFSKVRAWIAVDERPTPDNMTVDDRVPG